MHGDKLGSPVLSTYSIGGDTSAPRRGGGLALPVIVILGTVSVAAVVSYSFDGETPTVSDQRTDADDLGTRSFALEPPMDSVVPGFSGDESFAAGEGAQAAPEAEAARQGLPYLGVLQPSAAQPAVQPATGARANLSSRHVDRPVRLAMPSAPVSAPPVAECVLGCDAADPLQPSAPQETTVAALDAELSETVMPVATGDLAKLERLSDATAPVAPLAGIVAADAADAAAGAQADAPQAMLAVPSAELVAAAPDLGPAATGEAESPSPELVEPTGEFVTPAPDAGVVETAPTDTPPVEASIATAERSGDDEESTAAFTQEPPTASTPSNAADAAAGTTIPQHLARIGERYAAVPAAEPVAPDLAAIPHDDPQADLSPVTESTVAVSLDGAPGSSVIVQEDELVAIRLSELVALLEDRFDHPLYVWIKSSAAASKFVTAETLAAAGIRTRYDAQRNQIVFSTTDD